MSHRSINRDIYRAKLANARNSSPELYMQLLSGSRFSRYRKQFAAMSKAAMEAVEKVGA